MPKFVFLPVGYRIVSRQLCLCCDGKPVIEPNQNCSRCYHLNWIFLLWLMVQIHLHLTVESWSCGVHYSTWPCNRKVLRFFISMQMSGMWQCRGFWELKVMTGGPLHGRRFWVLKEATLQHINCYFSIKGILSSKELILNTNVCLYSLE